MTYLKVIENHTHRNGRNFYLHGNNSYTLLIVVSLLRWSVIVLIYIKEKFKYNLTLSNIFLFLDTFMDTNRNFRGTLSLSQTPIYMYFLVSRNLSLSQASPLPQVTVLSTP